MIGGGSGRTDGAGLQPAEGGGLRATIDLPLDREAVAESA